MTMLQRMKSRPFLFVVFVLIGMLFYSYPAFATLNSALQFDGSSAYVNLGSNNILKPTSAITIEMWVNPGSIQVAYADIISAHGYGYAIEQNDNTTNQYYFSYWNGNEWLQGPPLMNLQPNTWQFIAVQTNGATVNVYVDGLLVSSTPGIGPIVYTSGLDVKLGAFSNGAGRYWNGQMSDVSIWNTYRTQTEIQQDMYTQFTGSESGLVGYWPMDEGSGSEIHDLTANGDNGTATGGYSWVSADYITSPNAPTSLAATAGDAQVSLSWTTVSGATSYNIKRATTAGGPYSTIASVDSSVYTYTDSGLTNGTTYYYVVTAVNGGGESPNSNEASAMPTSNTGNATLTITRENGPDLSFNLTMDQVDAFISWYNGRANGIGLSYYGISVPAAAPYTGQTDYLIFEKIVSFTVSEY